MLVNKYYKLNYHLSHPLGAGWLIYSHNKQTGFENKEGR